MHVTARPMASPALQRELPQDVLPIWPALVQQFERVSQSTLMTLRNASSAEAQSYIEAQEAAATLPLIEQAFADASIDPMYLQLTAAAAFIKLGDLPRARAHLRAFAASPALTASLGAPARPAYARLIGAHPLWLLMHVAIEARLGPQLVQDVLASGLYRRLALEPELAAGLLLNALKHGDTETLAALQAARVALTPRARARLNIDSQEFIRELQGRAKRQAPLTPTEQQYVARRQQALALLDETPLARALTAAGPKVAEQPEVQTAAPWRRFLHGSLRRHTAPLPPQPRATAPQ